MSRLTDGRGPQEEPNLYMSAAAPFTTNLTYPVGTRVLTAGAAPRA